MADRAWMLRQDGKAFPLIHHLYTMQDEDLSSEAEVAAFLVSTKSKDQDLAKYVLDSWMALLLEDVVSFNDTPEDIIDKLINQLNNLPYKFLYPISVEKLLNIHTAQSNFDDFDTLYDFIDEINIKLNEIQSEIKYSINQQFCRVRFGGQYNSAATNNEIWFRISSTCYNWANTIYTFTTENKRKLKIDNVTICRDYESDYGDVDGNPEYFYTAKDGTPYLHMPIEEYLVEEHEHNPVFSTTNLNRGVLATIKNNLRAGDTWYNIMSALDVSNVRLNYELHPKLVRQEKNNCIVGSEYLDSLATRSRMRMERIIRSIKAVYPEITDVDIENSFSHENTKGKNVGSELIFKIYSENPKINELEMNVVITKDIGQTDVGTIFRKFRKEYEEYKQFMEI
jgi:hypothetical protein